MPDNSLDHLPLAVGDEPHVGCLMVTLDRLMGLRDVLVALNGPLANDPRFRENLHKHLFNDKANSVELDDHGARLVPGCGDCF